MILIFVDTEPGAAAKCQHDDQLVSQLRAALVTRALIGQATGILMERYKLTADDAFHLLVRVSQHCSMKLRDVAQHLVVTGEIPPGMIQHEDERRGT